MKKLIYLTLVSFLLLASCGGNQNKTEEQKTDDTELEKTMKSSEFDKADNCDEFIFQYEEWMNNYLSLLEKYMKNPMDQTLMEQYMKVSQEAISWVDQWTNLATCAGNEKYQKRFEEISAKADKKLKELGLD